MPAAEPTALRDPSRDRRVLGLVLMALVAIEWIGRRVHGPQPGEVSLLVEVAVLGLLVCTVIAAHTIHPLGFLRPLRRRFVRWRRWLRDHDVGARLKRKLVLAWGAELRPPRTAPSWRLPRAHIAILAVCAALPALAILDAGRLLGPGPWAAAVGEYAHVVRLAILLVWWGLLASMVTLFVFMAAVAFRFAMRHAALTSIRRRGLGIGAGVVVLACFAPAWCAVAALVVVVAVHLLHLRRRPGQPPVVARDDRGVVRYRAPGGYAEWGSTVTLAAFAIVPTALSGALLPADEAGDVAVGSLLGQLLGWSAAASAAAFVYLHMSLVPRAWPRTMRVGRVDAMRLRYALLQGLGRAVRAVEDRTFSSGEGLVIGVQYWFVPGLIRDVQSVDPDDDVEIDEALRGVDEALLGIVGPPFDVVLSAEAREHHGRVMRALDLDLVFVQDGVKWRGLERVLQRMFRVYDESNGERAVEERDFVGLEDIEVVIQELAHEPGPVTDAAASGYQEPSYEEVGTARILLVFKKRHSSDEAEPSEPRTSDHRPLVGSGV